MVVTAVVLMKLLLCKGKVAVEDEEDGDVMAGEDDDDADDVPPITEDNDDTTPPLDKNLAAISRA